MKSRPVRAAKTAHSRSTITKKPSKRTSIKVDSSHAVDERDFDVRMAVYRRTLYRFLLKNEEPIEAAMKGVQLMLAAQAQVDPEEFFEALIGHLRNRFAENPKWPTLSAEMRSIKGSLNAHNRFLVEWRWENLFSRYLKPEETALNPVRMNAILKARDRLVAELAKPR